MTPAATPRSSTRSGREELVGRCMQLHRDQFGRTPTHIAATPGRVNLIGEHTDYNQGLVFPMGIDRYVAIAASPAEGGARRLIVYSDAARETAEIRLNEEILRRDPGWSNYVRGVAAGLIRRGYPVAGLDLTIASTVPLGAGLSSSAALEVATVSILESTSGLHLDPMEKALLCQTAEHEFALVPCGLMDQMACVFSRHESALFIDCRDLSVKYVPFSNPQIGVLICNSNVRHSLGSSAYGTRRSECEHAARLLGKSSLREATLEELSRSARLLGSPLLQRARHVITENERVRSFAVALEGADMDSAGSLMHESHVSLRDDFQVSCRELDLLVDLADGLGRSAGVFGSRMTGGGFGGCTVSLIRMERAEEIADVLAARYHEQTGRTADVFITRPAEGIIGRRSITSGA